MTDDEFVAAFEAAQLSEFHHGDHVRAAWCYLQSLPVLAALDRFTTALKRFAAAQGKPHRDHETITWAYLFLIHERMSDGETWSDFAEKNGDLLAWRPSILDRYYRPETIGSQRARATFVLPDALTAP